MIFVCWQPALLHLLDCSYVMRKTPAKSENSSGCSFIWSSWSSKWKNNLGDKWLHFLNERMNIKSNEEVLSQPHNFERKKSWYGGSYFICLISGLGLNICFNISIGHQNYLFLINSFKKNYGLKICPCIYSFVDSIHLSSRPISAVIYLKVVGAQNQPNHSFLPNVW